MKGHSVSTDIHDQSSRRRLDGGGPKREFKEIVAENFPNLVKDINLWIHGVDQSPNKINLNKSMPRHIIIKLLKTKDKIAPNSHEHWKLPKLFILGILWAVDTSHCGFNFYFSDNDGHMFI